MEEALRAKLATSGFDNLDDARRFAQAVSKDRSRSARTGIWASITTRNWPLASGGLRAGARRKPQKLTRAGSRLPSRQLRLPQGRAAPGKHRLPRFPRLRAGCGCRPNGHRRHELPGLVDALIVDLRQNGGGDTTKIQLSPRISSSRPSTSTISISGPRT